MNRRILALVVVLPFALAACEGSGPKQTGGTLLGAGLGGLLGSQVGKGSGKLAAVAVGTLAGAMIGSEVGKSLDHADQLAMRRTSQTALETNRSGMTSTWVNPDTGHRGTITPKPAYQTAAGQQCREYQQTVTVGGKTEEAYGTACRQPDGSWKIVN